MQRDGIVKSLEQLIPHAGPARNAHPARAKGPESKGPEKQKVPKIKVPKK
jgi:hypothetical protein